MKNKGFTLIELIAVIVIMGMLLLIVFPATTRLLRSNENKKYDNYYDAVQEQIELYARTRRDELGGIKGSGCVDDKKLSDLKSFDYIKEFTEEKGVKCLSPSDFTNDRLQALGIDPTKQYVNVKIENDKGRISVKYSMICVKNYEDDTVTSLQYKRLIEREGTCENYVPVVTNSLLNVIKDTFTVENKGTTSYLTGSPTNNYVWYSGKMWRIINYDLTSRTIKLVTDDVVSIVNYNDPETLGADVTNDYSSSNMYKWLQKYFLPSLRNPEKYLDDVSWNYSKVLSNVSEPLTTGTTSLSKVGLLNVFDYNISHEFLDEVSKNFWLISTVKDTTNKAWYVNTSGIVTSSHVGEFYGVRPSVVLKPNVTVVNGGNGTFQNPYRLVGDISGNIGTYINTRFPGEYVSLNGALYRISTADPKYTKLTAINTIPLDSSVATLDHITPSDYNIAAGTIKLHFFDKIYNDNTFIGEYLSNWAAPLEDYLVEGDFCRMSYLKTTPQYSDCPQAAVFNSKIALPKIGDLYTVYSDKEYWTINNSTEDKLNVVNTNCTISEKVVDIENPDGAKQSSILPVLVIDNNYKIEGGNGTSTSPYTIAK